VLAFELQIERRRSIIFSRQRLDNFRDKPINLVIEAFTRCAPHDFTRRVDEHNGRPAAHSVLLQISMSPIVDYRCSISYRRIAWRMFSVPALGSELGRVYADDTSSFGYLCSSFLRSGIICMQLMQQKVQKSNSTTLPFSWRMDKADRC